jgi:anaerobic ribonucleoside-triphosphate reductase activating protein
MGNYWEATDVLIRIAGIANDSIVDGPGIRYTIFAQGCDRRCEGCHNPKTWDKSGGFFANIPDIIDDIKENPMLDGVTFSGGEPFLQAKEFAVLAKFIKENSFLNIICYSGYTYEYLLENATPENGYRELLSELDYLIDGEYKWEERSHDLYFMGSKNQRFINVKASLRDGAVKKINNQKI